MSHSGVRKLAGSGATVADGVILRKIFDPGGTSSGRLAASTGLTRGSVSQFVDRTHQGVWGDCAIGEGRTSSSWLVNNMHVLYIIAKRFE